MGAATAAALVVLAPLPAAAQEGKVDRSWRQTLRKPAAGNASPVHGLPHARGRGFRTLDDYLAYLRTYAAPTDRPWYREVRPGVFRLETGNLRSDAAPKLFTRAELERRFGFRRSGRDGPEAAASRR